MVQPPVQPGNKAPTKTTRAVWRPVGKHPDAKVVEAGGHFVYFQNLAKIRTMKAGERMVKLDEKGTKLKAKAVTLPIDWAKSINFPMDGNDNYGDCYMAAGSHADNTWAGNSGTPFTFALGSFSTRAGTDTSILARYGYLSGGDNGLGDSDMQGEMMGQSPGQGYIANGLKDTTRTIPCQVKAGSIVDWMQFDPTNPAVTQAMIQRYGVVIVTFGVPDAWLNNSDTGAVWDAPATPDQNNGHAVIWNGCRASDGAYCLQTWGSYVWVTPKGATAAQFQGWVAFSPRWFNSLGYAPNGEHITALAAQWATDGGAPIPGSIISQFPPAGPVPPSSPVVSGPASASAVVGTPFSAQIVASNSPTSYGAVGLPAGLAVNIQSGVISGTPTVAGNSTVTLAASNVSGTGSATMALSVTASPVPPATGTGKVIIQIAGLPDVTNTFPIPSVSGGGVTLTDEQLNALKVLQGIVLPTKPAPPPPAPAPKKAASLTLYGPLDATASLANDFSFRSWLKEQGITAYGAISEKELTQEQREASPTGPTMILQDADNRVLSLYPLARTSPEDAQAFVSRYLVEPASYGRGRFSTVEFLASAP